MKKQLFIKINLKNTLTFCTMLLTLGLISGSAFAKKSEDKDSTSAKSAFLKPNQVSEAMSQVWCKKLQECSPESGMKQKECLKVLNESFLGGFQRLPAGQKIQLTAEQLDTCVASVDATACGDLHGARQLQGCDFINYLNRQ